ncbi:MAG: type II toxin-antitoxin system RelE/ParE family toxin [Sulfuricellaceae bacterium]|nr:type II toxin-antitoxin system RelE/ParE family toxin [Sulfuricellaceae bacterium]
MPKIGDDFERIFAYLAQHDAEGASSRIPEIIQALNILKHNPLIGQLVSGDERELVIGHRARGYVALYRYIDEIDTIFVLAIRSQREAGFTRPFEENP